MQSEFFMPAHSICKNEMASSKAIKNAALHSYEISEILWEIDPMRTGCTEDAAMRDEYELQAKEIASRVDAGAPLRAVVVEVFDKWFWDDCLIFGAGMSRLDIILEKISKINR